MSALSGRRVESPTLVGRDAESASLMSAVLAPPAVVSLHGDAGLGKTRLVTDLAGRPEVSNRRWAIGTCPRIREPFPLGPVTDALRDIGESLSTASFSPVVGALRPLLPELACWLPPQLPPLVDRASERHRLFRGMAEVFSSLGPAVLVLEDMHWADSQTPEFVSYLLADPPAHLTIVLTFRTGEGDAVARAATAKLPASVSRTEISLAPLDEAQTGTLTATILGQQQVSTEFAGYIWERTSGVPFAIEELLALLEAQGTLVRRREGWVRKRLNRLDVPAGIRAQVLERVGVLSDRTREVVEAAAVLQSPTSAPALLATCRASGDEARRGLDEALQAGVLVTADDLIGFRHLLAARAVADNIPSPSRQDLHSRAVGAMEALDPVPLGRLAYHLRHAGRLDEWATVAERAADQAGELGHDAEAARLLEDVLRDAALDGERQGRLAIKLARAAIETLHVTEDLTNLLREVLGQDLPVAMRGELRFRLALLHEAAGADPARVRELYVTAVDELDDRPNLKAWAMMGLGIHTAIDVRIDEHRRWVHRVLDILPDTDPPAFRAFLLGKAAMVLVSIGDPSWRELAQRLGAQTGHAPLARDEVNAYQSLGMAACYAGHHQEAARFLTSGLDSPVTRDNRKLELRMRSAMAFLDFCCGRWDGLSDTVDKLLDDLADYPLARVDIEVVAGCLALAHGRVDQSRQRLIAVAKESAKLGAYELVAPAVGALARLAATTRVPDDVLASQQEFVAAVSAKGFWMPVTRALPGLAQALVAAGHHAEAKQLVQRCVRELEPMDAPLASPAVLHAQGWLDAHTQQQEAAGHFRLAAERYDSAGCPYEAAQAREAAADCLLDVGASSASDPLVTALRTYQRLGAGWDRDRVAATARRHGISVPALHRGGRHGYHDELSPREREVAILVATGRTNKEIASELYISPRTVEKHISGALRKLGLRTRTALARHLEESTERPGPRMG